MRFSYCKLWSLLALKGLKKKDLKENCGISSATIAKLQKGENVTTDVLLKICIYLNCNIEDIMELSR